MLRSRHASSEVHSSGRSPKARKTATTAVAGLIASAVLAGIVIFVYGMWPLVCVGESGPDRDAGRAEEVVARQLEITFSAVSADVLARLMVAYEPWWAIGEGSVAAPLDHVARLHGLIHDRLASHAPAGTKVPVLYGGSVDLDNAEPLLGTAGVDGLFVGRAALDADTFARIALGSGAPAPARAPSEATA